MRLNILSILLIVPMVYSALVTDYIVTTNVAGAVLTMTSIYDPATKVAANAAAAAANDDDDDDAADATTTKGKTTTTTNTKKTTQAAKALSVKTLKPITITSQQTAADGSLQNVINTYTPVVSQFISTNAAGKTVTASTTVTPGLVSTDTAVAAADAVVAGGVTTLDPVVSTHIQTAANGALQTVITTYTPYVSQVLSTNPAGVPVTVTATITPGLITTDTAATATKAVTNGITTVVTSTLANGGLTIYTTVIPQTAISSKKTNTKYSNPRDRPDPSTSITPQPASPVTTLSWQSYATITFGDTTFTTSLAPIIVWVTITTNGAVATVSTTFIQRYSSQYNTVAVPSSGSIGLGSLTGKIGVVKTEFQSTMKYNNNGFIIQYSPVWSFIAFLLSWLL